MSTRRAYLVCYDIADDKRLRRVARICSGYGERVQFSVFACPLDRMLIARLKAELLPVIHHDDDQVLFAVLGAGSEHGPVETIGRPTPQRERVTVI